MNRIISMLLAIFIGIAAAAPAPATPTDFPMDDGSVSVCVELDTPMEEIQYGNTITLRCVVDGMEEPYFIQWQCSEDKEEWVDVPCHTDLYEFVLTEETAGIYYRVIVSRGSVSARFSWLRQRQHHGIPKPNIKLKE